MWKWPEGEAAPEELWLIVREDSHGQLKYSLTNAPADTPLNRLARFYVERVFQDAKSHCGMPQYQARG